MVVSAQFPLGTVLFPTMVLPLHVFEPRYRALVDDVLSGDRTFGVVLIERGSEVGGNDRRSNFGTLARVLEAEQTPDGRWALIAVGIERFKVNTWLDDDPYPRAEIDAWPDADAERDLAAPYAELSAKFARCMALASEAGMDVGPMPELSDDAGIGSLQLSSLAPVTAFDKQSLLGVSGPSERIELLDRMIDDAVELIELRLANE